MNFAEDIANIQDGLKKAVEEAVKGERMKTELITNVSHDLKTPLTSIITYVDLLRQQKLENPTAKEYVEVLHVKSYRLKQLIGASRLRQAKCLAVMLQWKKCVWIIDS